MTRIAHISDLHLLEPSWRTRGASSRARLSFLSFGRQLDFALRRQRLTDALAWAVARNCDHVLMTGDLTEDGTAAQFDVLADVLNQSGIDPARVTIVPGNHDLYTDASAWDRAIEGPLRPYRETSTLNEPVSLEDVTILPVSTAVHQSVLRSAGYVPDEDFESVRRTTEQTKGEGAPLLLAMHHPPHRHLPHPMQWVDGLQGADRVTALLCAHRHVFVAHGHTHHRTDHALDEDRRARVFCAHAIADREGAVRCYEASRGCVSPIDDLGHLLDTVRVTDVPNFTAPSFAAY